MAGGHGQLTTSEGIHIAYQWSYADAAARTGATGFVAADVGKMARQLDNNTLWMLTATTPTWVKSGGPDSAIDHGSVANLTTGDPHTQYLLAGGSKAGATDEAQDFGANGVKADTIAESTGGNKIAVSHDFDMASGKDIFPDNSTNGLNARFENLFGDDVPADDPDWQLNPFYTTSGDQLGFETDANPYTPGGNFTKAVTGSPSYYTNKHHLVISTDGSSTAKLTWTNSTATEYVELVGMIVPVNNTSSLVELRGWTVQSPGGADNYASIRWRYDATTYPDWPYRIEIWTGTGVTFSTTDGTKQVSLPYLPFASAKYDCRWWNGSTRISSYMQSIISPSQGVVNYVDYSSAPFSTQAKTVTLYVHSGFNRVYIDSWRNH